MIGWTGMQNQLATTPVLIKNSSSCNFEHEEMFCGTEILNTNTECGGNLGGPIFCLAEDNLVAIVIEDNFCGIEASGAFLLLSGYQDWIEKVSIAGSFVGLPNIWLTSFITGLIFMTK